VSKVTLEKIDPEHYILSRENKEITGFWTVAEWAAYDQGREHGELIYYNFIKNWDGSTNSGMGQILNDLIVKYASSYGGNP
jgi:hypothetical protein